MQDYISGIAPPVREQPRAVPEPSRHEPPPAPAPVIHTEESPPAGQVSSGSTERVQDQVSRDELAEMLRKVNLTFDLFEIAAEYSIEEDGKRISITVRNTRTGEILRRIPPGEFLDNLRDIRQGLGMHINASI